MIIEILFLLTLSIGLIILLTYIKANRVNIINKIFYKTEIQKESLNEKDPFDYLKSLFYNEYIEYRKPKSNFSFTILTYNILAQKYVQNKNKNNLIEGVRIKKVIDEINSNHPDIFCLQEVTDKVYNKYLKENFENKYKIIAHINEGSFLINLIAINQNRFKIISEQIVGIKENKIKIEGNRGIINVTLTDNLVKGKFINLFCVHFPWNPIYEYEKAKILKLIFDNITDKKIENVIIAGDFNSIPNSIVLRMIYFEGWIKELNDCENYTNSFKPTKSEKNLNDFVRMLKKKKKEGFDNLLKKSEEINSKYFLRSSYENYQPQEKSAFGFLRNHPKYTNYTKKFINTIDYIIYSKQLNLLKILKIPEIENEKNKEFLPNNLHPSDHLKLVSSFEYN